MGIASILEPRFRSAIPDTPPETHTPDLPIYYSSRQSEERSWNPSAPPSPPMSNYDPAVKAHDMPSSSSSLAKGPEDREVASDQAAPRQQLPSLSSLFGPPSHMRSFHSPLSDRAGSYTSGSPLDRPLPPTSAGLDRPYSSSSSYFPPTSAAPSNPSQPRSVLEPRYPDHRPRIPSLSRTFPGPLSPQLREDQQQQHRYDARPEVHSSGSPWSAQHETRGEYSFDSRRDQPYRPSPTADRYPTHLPGSAGRGVDEVRRNDYREQLNSQAPPPPPHSLPPTSTPASRAEPTEGVPVKDGLGPKIWTGTHFLPRFVRAAEVPGEGMCYFYDDGSHCKTVIDGEVVNAHWGVTKAGKPRKRLAIACVTCREKKIKCDPDYPRCVQCEKFGRVCKFKNAPRGGHNSASSPSTPPSEPVEDIRRLGGSIIRPPSDYTRPSSHSSESVSPRTHRPPSPDLLTSGPSKRARMGYEHYSPTAAYRSPAMPSVHDPHGRPPLPWPQPVESLPRVHEDLLHRPWQSDPYVNEASSHSRRR